jgi:hypothetical protein
MRFIKISVNPDKVKSKEEGANKTEFMVQKFDLDDPNVDFDLETICRNNVHSMNHFSGGVSRVFQSRGYTGRSRNASYSGVWGVALDFDDGLITLEEAKREFGKYINIIYTSTNHRINKPDHGGVVDRFRVILPFEPKTDGTAYFEGETAGDSLYSYLKEQFPQADPRIFNRSAKLYPFTGTNPELYKFYLNKRGEWFEVSMEDLKIHSRLTSARLEAKQRRSKNQKTFSLNDVVVLSNKKDQVYIRDIKKKTPCYCLFCDDLNSKSASAFIALNDHGDTYIWCSHCRKTYWSDDPQINPDLISLWFDHSAGHAAFYDKNNGDLKFFKNIKDWVNFCEQRLLNPFSDGKLTRALLKFDPATKYGIDRENRTFNIFAPSQYLQQYKDKIKPDLGILKHKTPRIYSILKNVLGDETTIGIFLNWIAFILQFRRKSTLAWIITSTARGTGKEVLVKLVLGPVFGQRHTQIMQGSHIGDRFNKEDAYCWLRCYDEVFQAGDTKANLERREWLKTKIGSYTMTIEPKGIDKIELESHINYVLLSNSIRAVLLEEGDRRFNVVRNPDAVPLHSGMDWWVDGPTMEKEIVSEIPIFAEYIQKIEVNYQQANYPTDSKARFELLEESKDNIQYFADRLSTGDVEFFELDSVFPGSEVAGNGHGWHTDANNVCSTLIRQKCALPVKYLNHILRYHFKYRDPISIRRRLKSDGIIIDTVRLGKESYRCFRAI